MNDIATKTKPRMIKESYTASIKKRWQTSLASSEFTIKLLTSIIIFIIGAVQLSTYFKNIQKREGIELSDFVLNHIPALDVSTPIFTTIYGMLIYMLCKVFTKPQVLLLFTYTFVIETIFRMSTIYLFPLNPPANLVILHDTFAEIAIYGNSEPITKDLFFSGHTSTMVMIWLFLETPREKVISAIAAVVLAVLLLIQHVHYTIDVLGAVFFTVLAYFLARYILQLRWQISCVIMAGFYAIMQIVFILAGKII